MSEHQTRTTAGPSATAGEGTPGVEAFGYARSSSAR